MKSTYADRRAAYLLILSMGLLSLIAGIFLLFGQGITPVAAQEGAEATAEAAPSRSRRLNYEGSGECDSCHRGQLPNIHQESPHALALQRATGGAILADFSGSDVPELQFPGEDAARQLTPDDIAYVIGAGRVVQRYLYDAGDGVYLVFPFEWNVEEQAWQSYSPGHPWPDPTFDWNTNCAGCHTTGYDVETGKWEEEGVQCEACHGPASEHMSLADEAGRRASDDEIEEIRAAIYNGPDAQMCGQCHGAGQSAGGEFPFAAGFVPGDTLSDSYRLVAPDDSAHWWPTGHARQINMQYNEWIGSAHANSLTALLDSGQQVEDRCLSCHSADAAYQQRRIAQYEAGDMSDPAPQAATADSAQYGVTCVTCHAPHKAGGDGERAAFQTGSSDEYGLCVQCHSGTTLDFIHYPSADMFEGVEIVANVPGVPSSHFTEETGPRCATCHMAAIVTTDGVTINSHSLQPVLPGPAINVEGLQDSCITCHRRQVDALDMQRLIDDVQNDTRARLDTARAAIQETTADWAKTALAFVEGDGSLGIHNYAYTDALLDAVEAELGLDEPDTGNTPSTGS